MDTVLLLASLVSAIGILAGALIKLYKFVKKVDDKFEEYDKTIKQNTLHILKIALLDEDLPRSDRIHAGEQYLALGGNGYGKIIYNKLLKEYEKEMENHGY